MNFNHCRIAPQAIERAKRVLESGFVSEGEIVKEFERELSRTLGIPSPVTVNSGTAALHLSLVVAGVKSGHEVVIPPQTFIATGMAVLMQGATPVFADIQLDTGNIDPVSIESKVSEKTKAVIPVHWAGYPCDMDEIHAIARSHGITVVEDAAHALGARYKGKVIGSLSDFTAFSFQATKQVTTGDGGAITCMNPENSHRARTLRWFSIDRAGSKPSDLGERTYDAGTTGYKYHMNDIAAAIGLGNLVGYPAVLETLRGHYSQYRAELKGVTGVTLLRHSSHVEPAPWLFTLRVERRAEFIRAMKSRGVPVSVKHLRIDDNSVFGGVQRDLMNMNRFNEEQVSLPIHPGLSPEDICFITTEVKKGW